MNNITNTYPVWYFFNDSLMIIGNALGVFVALLFIVTVIRLDHPSYPISNFLSCNTCLAIMFASADMLADACYALASDFRGVGYHDSLCTLRGTLLSASHGSMYISLCLQAFNRLCCIVHPGRRWLQSFRFQLTLISIQWIVAAVFVLPVTFTVGIPYHWGSHLCQASMTNTLQFSYLMMVYYLSISFIVGVYLYILYYVRHLPIMEQYRRQRQITLYRRVLFLLTMLVVPGTLYSVFLIRWAFFDHTPPPYSLKISMLLVTIGQTGAVMTLFISNSRVRHHWDCPRQCTKQEQKRKPIEEGTLENLPLKIQRLTSSHLIIITPPTTRD